MIFCVRHLIFLRDSGNPIMQDLGKGKRFFDEPTVGLVIKYVYPINTTIIDALSFQ